MNSPLLGKYNKHTYFWDGPFSQWSRSPFFIDGKDFVTAEQYMMYKKALTFGDTKIALAILDEENPREQKAMGRLVSNFNPDIWNALSRDVVFRGSMAKYTQNKIHFDALLATKGTLLVEASPYDKIWGIGLDAEDAACTLPEDWPGTNWLGQILTEVREVLQPE